MPITETEWKSGRLEGKPVQPAPTPVADKNSHSETIEAFLRENRDLAFTRAEIVRGIQCSVKIDPERFGRLLTGLPNQLADIESDLAAGGMAVGEVSQAVDELVATGQVQCGRIERQDGEPVIYYRIADKVSGCGDDR